MCGKYCKSVATLSSLQNNKCIKKLVDLEIALSGLICFRFLWCSMCTVFNVDNFIESTFIIFVFEAKLF